MKILWSFILFISCNSHAFTVEDNSSYSCNKFKKNCEYYTCIETQKQCGESGYLASFGRKYCQRFQDDISKKLSKNGQDWLIDVRSCLIDELSEISLQIGCNQLRTEALKSHLPCYRKTGFCKLKRQDKYKIINVLKAELANFEVLKTGLFILFSCALF